jgi:hypothetical protein
MLAESSDCAPRLCGSTRALAVLQGVHATSNPFVRLNVAAVQKLALLRYQT